MIYLWVVKFITLILIFGGTSFIGILVSKRYENRLRELEKLKTAIHMLEVKIKFTYDTIPKIFREIELKIDGNIGKIFGLAQEKMNNFSLEKSWNEAIEDSNCFLLSKDKEILKDLGKTLGQTDIEGQLNQINLIYDFLDMQIKDAVLEKQKNQKLYKTLRNGCRTCYCNYISLSSIVLYNRIHPFLIQSDQRSDLFKNV